MLICGVGDKDTEDKKMGGEATIDCQYYNIAAIQGPGNTNCPTCGKKHKRFWGWGYQRNGISLIPELERIES